MRMLKSRKLIRAAIGMTVIIVAGIAGCRADDRHHVRTMLNIAQLPASVSDIDCASFGITDVLERCSFQIAPADFNILLSGYKYDEFVDCDNNRRVGFRCLEHSEKSERSHSICCGPKVGPDFAIATDFVASPKEFKHGGTVSIVANQARTRAMIDLYIE